MPRGIELDRGRLIAYSLGNLAGYRNVGIGPVTGTSALLQVRLGPNGTFVSGAGAIWRSGSCPGMRRSMPMS